MFSIYIMWFWLSPGSSWHPTNFSSSGWRETPVSARVGHITGV